MGQLALPGRSEISCRQKQPRLSKQNWAGQLALPGRSETSCRQKQSRLSRQHWACQSGLWLAVCCMTLNIFWKRHLSWLSIEVTFCSVPNDPICTNPNAAVHIDWLGQTQIAYSGCSLCVHLQQESHEGLAVRAFSMGVHALCM